MGANDQPTETANGRAGRVITVLRLAAITLLAVGFVGWTTDEGVAFSLESPFTLAFLAGVGCAVVSIYLGVLLANRDG